MALPWPSFDPLGRGEVRPQRRCGLCPEARRQGQERGCQGEGRRSGRGLVGLRASCVSFSGAEGQDMNPGLLGGDADKEQSVSDREGKKEATPQAHVVLCDLDLGSGGQSQVLGGQ